MCVFLILYWILFLCPCERRNKKILNKRRLPAAMHFFDRPGNKVHYYFYFCWIFVYFCDSPKFMRYEFIGWSALLVLAIRRFMYKIICNFCLMAECFLHCLALTVRIFLTLIGVATVCAWKRSLRNHHHRCMNSDFRMRNGSVYFEKKVWQHFISITDEK